MVRILIGGLGIFTGSFCATFMFFSNPSVWSFLIGLILLIFLVIIGIKYMIGE